MVLWAQLGPGWLNREAYADPLPGHLEPGCQQESLGQRAPTVMILAYQDRSSRSNSVSWKEWQGSER